MFLVRLCLLNAEATPPSWSTTTQPVCLLRPESLFWLVLRARFMFSLPKETSQSGNCSCSCSWLLSSRDKRHIPPGLVWSGQGRSRQIIADSNRPPNSISIRYLTPTNLVTSPRRNQDYFQPRSGPGSTIPTLHYRPSTTTHSLPPVPC